MNHFGVILSGCGVYDGSDIHEAVLTTYFLDKKEVKITYLAPNINQYHVIDHLIGEEEKETRNCLKESARIARGAVVPLNEANVQELDAAIVIGGFGAAKNLSDFAIKQKELTVNEDLSQFITKMNTNKKPLGFLCIAPVIIAKLIPGVITTLGLNQNDLDTLEALGAGFRQANYDDVVIDNTHNVYSTPAYMINTSISKIAIGIEKLVNTMLESTKSSSISEQEAITA